MSETLTKLRPDRDLQCYFQLPSAIAALSESSPNGFTLSGTWRQQFDWAVVEWNRDNVFEHPQLRNLPDGDFSGVVLSYQETRVNCIQADSSLYATVDWPSLRIWADPGTGVDTVYYVPLSEHATAVAGVTTQASATFTLSGAVTTGDIIGLECAESHYYYTIAAGDTIDTAAAQLALVVNSLSMIVTAKASGAAITLTVLPTQTTYSGGNGKWLGAYGVVFGTGGTEFWQPVAQQFSGGQSPSTWALSLDFSQLKAKNGIPTDKIRKMRWTYAADLQRGAFQPGEFSVVVTNWSVTGTGLAYSVAGPGSRRIEDTSSALTYTGVWTADSGNYSGGSVHYTTGPATCTYQFIAERVFDVYIGTRGYYQGSQFTVTTDNVTTSPISLFIDGEDVLIRVPAGTVQPGPHTLTLKYTGTSGTFYLDFIELVVPSQQLPSFVRSATTTLATDWDTYHSSALAPERTAWLIYTLGFTGRANHYAGALQFFELVREGQVYASVTIEFGGSAQPGSTTTLSIGSASSGKFSSSINHFHVYGDTTATIALAFAQNLNSGYTSVWAQASGNSLTIQARAMGSDGNDLTIGITTTDPSLNVPALSQLTGGVDGMTGGVNDTGDFCGWRTDLTAVPRINRACRDWSTSFFKALKGYGIQATAAFSMELQFGDPSVAAGIAQCYPSGNPAIVNTPALQTNFSPASLAYWQQVYADMAQVMVNAGQTPYLQFGEVQWWYFPYVPPVGSTNLPGMPFYDAYTKAQFTAKYGQQMAVITSNSADPLSYPNEAQFLPSLIGAFTRSIQQFVRQTQPSTQFEVLYPPDTNNYSFTQVINLPASDWTAATLNCFKTENFTFTGDRDLTLINGSVTLPGQLGFPATQASHLVGISDPTTPWQREASMAEATGVESVVLFALDQYCLIGYQGSAPNSGARSFMIP